MKSTATELRKAPADRDFQSIGARGTRAPQLVNSRREDTSRAVPNLDDFAKVLETLAERLSYGPAGTSNWIGCSIVAAESKLRVLRMISRWASTKGRPARLLDIGSQIASLPVYAVRMGSQAAAVDNGEFATDCALAVRQLGVDYRIADVGRERLPFDDESFDFVTYMDVIEHHAYSPKRVLLEARRVLSPGGLLVVTTPNHASIYNRFALLFGKSVLDPFDYFFEGRAGDQVYPGHHREFTRAELRTMLEKSGYRVLECKSGGEGLGPQLRAMRSEAVNGWPAAIRKLGKFVVAETLEPVWSVLPASLGRVLWAVGQKPESTIYTGAVL
jgi:2-polyprenyl-3-methyl-5-hydroxy-6-metoxy-1,4-benzoquinol methylase